MAEVVNALVRANLVAAFAILAVMLLRRPARNRLGAEAAYALWAAPPLAAIATLIQVRHAERAIDHPLAHLVPAAAAGPILAVWGIGALLAALLLIQAQAVFLRELRAGRGGPAVVGVIAPRLVMPPDDGRYSAEERALIRAHEREHIRRQDPRAAALMAIGRCLAWFNPLVHLAADVARLDQELACDAAVVRRRPGCRALYAKTLLKAQLANAAVPLGCHWTARRRHPLEVRIELLKRRPTDEGLEAPLLVGAGLLAAAILAWAVEPPLPPSPVRGVDALELPEPHPVSVLLVSWPASKTAMIRR